MEKFNNLSITSFLSKLKSLKILSLLLFFVLFIISILYVVINNQGSFQYNIPLITKGSCSTTNESAANKDFDWNGTIYKDNDMTPYQMWLHNSNVTYEKYFDLGFAKDCGIPYKHSELFDLMKFWVNLTASYNIPWWMCYGSLIGAIRHKDMVPWDSDIDIAMPAQFEDLIRNLSTPRSQISEKKVNIVARPGPHCPYNGPRVDCKGNIVYSHVDGCAFCGPFVRLFYTSSKRIDIYLIDIKFSRGKLQLSEEGIFEYTSEIPYFPLEWYLPLRNCSFMGLTVQCPRRAEVILKNYYKTFQSYYKCEKGKWVLIKAR